MPEFTVLPPLSLYVHIPWCIKKCPYCDFNSHQAKQVIAEQDYVNALLQDLEQHLPDVWGRRLTSIFIGGGTPSLFSPDSLNQIISGIRMRMQCLPTMEITMEANPGTFEQEKFKEFRDLGINRLSIGIQSFDDEKLSALGRVHGRQEAINAAETAQQVGFDNFNLDLMFGLPQQTMTQGLNDLQTAIELNPAHISWYQLTVEPNTLFHKQPPTLPADDAIAELQDAGLSLLAEHDFAQYEISAYAKPDKQCQHNLNYWQFGDYLGIGAGAHGKISRSDNHNIQRHWKLRQPDAYMAAQPGDKTAGAVLLSDSDRIFEFMLNALRLKQGFNVELFERHTGLNRSVINDACQQAIEKGLLIQTADHLAPSAIGYGFLNDLINLFSD